MHKPYTIKQILSIISNGLIISPHAKSYVVGFITRHTVSTELDTRLLMLEYSVFTASEITVQLMITTADCLILCPVYECRAIYNKSLLRNGRN
jgi:hypothetical protein